jgi:predicted Zn-dependent peptidase
MTYKKTVLPNGLTIITADMPRMESISIGVWIGAGGRYEESDKAGISHFLEHMVFKGTQKRSAQALKEAIEGRGGALNGFTGEEFTCYLAKVLSKDAHIAVDVLCDMTLNPKLVCDDFEKERFVILEEIKMYMDMPNHHVQELLAELLWPDQPLGMPLAGTLKTVSGLRRDDLADYKSAFYSPRNIVVAMAGRFSSPGGLVKIIEKNFRTAPLSAKQGFSAVDIKQNSPRTNFFFKKTEQTHIAMGLHGYSRFSKDKYKLDLLHIILGGNMSSRLFQEVREKEGLAYEISSSVKHYHDTGALIISAGIDNKKVGKALKVILRELRKIKSRPVSRAEFIRAKEFYRGQLLMMFEETMHHMLWLGEKFMCNDPEFRATEILKRLDAVTVGDVRTAARGILEAGNVNLAVVGPTAKKEAAEIRRRISDL